MRSRRPATRRTRALQADLAEAGDGAPPLLIAQAFGALIQRLRAGTDHGLAGTVLEELYRRLYADKIGAFLWDEVKASARAAYTPNPAARRTMAFTAALCSSSCSGSM